MCKSCVAAKLQPFTRSVNVSVVEKSSQCSAALSALLGCCVVCSFGRTKGLDIGTGWRSAGLGRCFWGLLIFILSVPG